MGSKGSMVGTIGRFAIREPLGGEGAKETCGHMNIPKLF